MTEEPDIPFGKNYFGMSKQKMVHLGALRALQSEDKLINLILVMAAVARIRMEHTMRQGSPGEQYVCHLFE